MFLIKKSPIEGNGAFAARDIKKGEAIIEMIGVRRSFKHLAREYYAGNKRANVDPFQIGEHVYIQLKNPCNYFNHSCEPNAAIKGLRTMVALRLIRKGEEVLYDYSATEWTPWDYPPYYSAGWPMRCSCGSARCRKLLACFHYLPKSIQRRYLKSGVIQDYIVKKAAGPEDKKRCFVCEAELAKRR